MWNFKQWIDKEAIWREFKGISQLLSWNNLFGAQSTHGFHCPWKPFISEGWVLISRDLPMISEYATLRELEKHTNASSFYQELYHRSVPGVIGGMRW